MTTSTRRTSLETAQTNLSSARGALELALEEEQDSRNLADKLNAIANAEGRLQVLARFWQAVESGAEAKDVIANLMESYLVTGADDTWSGRTNDVRRARFEGVSRALLEISELAS